MALRGKTKLKGQGSKSREQMAAAESGTAARQRATEGVARQHAAGAQQGLATGGQAAGIIQRQEQMEGQQDIAQQRVDLDAAKSGMMPNPRMEKLQADMDRGADQMGQPLEYEGQRFIPTPMAEKQAAASQGLAEEKAVTERLRAQAYRQQVAGQLSRANASGDKQGAKELKANLMQPIKSDVNRLDRMMTGKKLKPGDWEGLQKEAQNAQDMQLQADIESRQMTPRVRDFLSRKIAVKALDFIETTGDLPDGDLVDFTSQAMQQFGRSATIVQAIMQAMGPGFQQFSGITSIAEKNRFVNQLAAWHTKNALANPVQQQPGLLPSQSATPEQQQSIDNEQPQPAAAAAAGAAAGLQQPGGAALQHAAGASHRAEGTGPGNIPSTWEQAK